MSDSDSTSLTVLKSDPQETEAGNYFVANYPPFSFWSQSQRADALAALDRKPQADTPLGLYVHIPFCRKRCHFCYFKVYTDRNAEAIRRYMDAVITELKMYGERAFVDGRKPQFIYFGGGTPSYLSADQLKYFTDGLKSVLPWDEAEEVAFECEPGTLNENKLQAIRDMGVTRLSLGVEHFDDAILSLNNRAHESPQVYKAYDWARSVGFPQINIDLIAGMLDDTDENWQRCIDETLKLAPECVTIYQMEIPYNTTIYQRMKDEGKLTAPVADWKTKRRWVAEAFEQLEAAGYTVTSAYTAVKDPQHTQFVYRDALWRGADMIAVGVSSFGHINRTHMQNQAHIDPYIESVEAGELPIYRAMAVTEEEQMIREFILQMKLGRVSRRYWIDKFGVDVFDRFSDELSELAGSGVISLDDEGLTFSRAGLLKVDQYLPAFFLPQHYGARYT